MIASGTIEAIHIGTAQMLEGAGPRGAGLMTAYRKSPTRAAVRIDTLGVDGDTQVNRRFHGGPEKAVYGYPASGYGGWRTEFPEIAERFAPGAMGENLVVAGQDENSVHIGDIIRCGTALLQVSQIREPCSTFAAIFGTARVVRAMTQSARCGWYYRVLAPGMARAGDAHNVVERPNPDWPVARFARFAAGRPESAGAIAELASLPGLTPAWQQKAASAL